MPLFQDRTGFHCAYEQLHEASTLKLVEIGDLICRRRNMDPSELMSDAPMCLDTKIMEKIQRSISRNQQNSARK